MSPVEPHPAETSPQTSTAPAPAAPANGRRTAVGMVTIGPDSWTRRFSVERAKTYAAKYGYDFVQVFEPVRPNSGRTPHWEKMLLPEAFPGYDRYLILDDDIIINTRIAPALPEISEGALGMVREPVPTKFEPPMEWLGNTGVLLLDQKARRLLQAAYDMGEYKDIVPGYGDQPALNYVAWHQGEVAQLPREWNYMPLADWLHTVHGEAYPWTPNVALARLARFTFMGRLALGFVGKAFGILPRSGPMRRLRESNFIHLIWLRMGVRWISRFID